ncbi:MAG: rhodanese-like domain-containing protein [Pseudomonadota bacterium]
MAARLAAKLGYTNIRVFHAGVPAWASAGNVLLTTDEFVKTRMGFIVLIDTRGPDAAEKGHIQGAVAIRLKDIVREKNQFPVDRKAYIVLYAENTDLAQLAPVVKEISSWGYNNVFILDGGYAGWLKEDGGIQKGMVRTKIFYLPRPHPGEIVGDEFMNIVQNRPADAIILDVRTPTEAALGMIQGAVNIPVDELQKRANELPKDKGIITHCRTGLRAEMAYTILRNAGFKTRFLNDKVAVIDNTLYCCFK